MQVSAVWYSFKFGAAWSTLVTFGAGNYRFSSELLIVKRLKD